MTYQGFAAVDNARVYGVVSKSQILCSIASCSLSLHNTIMMITDLSTCQKRVIWEAASRSLVSSRKEFALNEILGFGLTYVPNNTCWASRPFRHWHALVSFSLTLSNPALMISLISVAPAQSPSNLRERRRVGLLWTSFCIAAMVVWPKKLLCQSWRQAPAPILRWGQIPRNTSIYGVATDGPSVPITHQADQTFEATRGELLTELRCLGYILETAMSITPNLTSDKTGLQSEESGELVDDPQVTIPICIPMTKEIWRNWFDC